MDRNRPVVKPIGFVKLRRNIRCETCLIEEPVLYVDLGKFIRTGPKDGLGYMCKTCAINLLEELKEAIIKMEEKP
jgi:hypothetical protein